MEASDLEPFRIKEDWKGKDLLGHFVHPLPIQDHDLLYNNFTNVLPSLNLNKSSGGDYITFFFPLGNIYSCFSIFSMKNCCDILLNTLNITIITRITYFLLLIVVSFLACMFWIYILTYIFIIYLIYVLEAHIYIRIIYVTICYKYLACNYFQLSSYSDPKSLINTCCLF